MIPGMRETASDSIASTSLPTISRLDALRTRISSMPYILHSPLIMDIPRSSSSVVGPPRVVT